MDKKILLEILKYIALTCLVYVIFKYLPNRTLENYDIVTLTIIVVLTLVLIENIYKLYGGEPTCAPPTQQQCSSVCSIQEKEHMINMEGLSGKSEMPRNIATIPPTMTSEAKMQTGPIMTGEAKIPTNRIMTGEAKVISPELLQELRQELKQELKQELMPKISSEQLVEGLNGLEGSFFHMKTQAPQENPNIQRGEKTRRCDGVIENEIEYTDYNHVPLSDNYNSDDFEYGYSFLPPEKWYPQPPFPPMCVTDKRCPVFPVNTMGTPLDAKEWNSSRRIMPPDNINTKYVVNKLNNGR